MSLRDNDFGVEVVDDQLLASECEGAAHQQGAGCQSTKNEKTQPAEFSIGMPAARHWARLRPWELRGYQS